jgi:hypothetical protein
MNHQVAGIPDASRRQLFMRQPNPSEVKSFTIAPSNCTTTVIGKVRGTVVVQVSKEGFVGLTAQVLLCSEIRTIRVFPAKSGADSTIRKLIKFRDRSQLVTSPVSRGGGGVGDISAVGEAGTVGDILVGNSVGVGWEIPGQNRASNSSFEAEYNDEEAENFPEITGCLIVPSGHI